LFDEIQTVEPRLSGRVADLREEHTQLSARAGNLADLLARHDDIDVVRLRNNAASLLTDLRGHRAAEADLVYEAFWMELGAVD
jgi:hypothetical protein